MYGTERVVGSVKSGLEEGAFAARLVARQAERLPGANLAKQVGRYVLYRTGTQYVLDGMVASQKNKMRQQIADERLVLAVTGLARHRVPRETLMELEALKEFVDQYGPTTYQELIEIEAQQASPPEEFPTRQLVRMMHEAERRRYF